MSNPAPRWGVIFRVPWGGYGYGSSGTGTGTVSRPRSLGLCSDRNDLTVALLLGGRQAPLPYPCLMVFRISDQNRNAQWIRQGAEVAKVPRSIASMTRAPSNPVRRCFLERARLPWKPTQERSSPAGTWTLRDHKLPISAAASLRWVTEMTSRHLSGLGDTADPLCLLVRITATRRPPTRTGTAARETRAPQWPPSTFPHVSVSDEYGHSTIWHGQEYGRGKLSRDA